MHTTTTAPLDNDGRDADTPPALPFVHMWTDLDGRSRLDESTLRGFGLQSVGGGADPQWMRPFPGEVTAVLFAALPVGWVGQWHPSPHPQWVIPLRGRWFLETQDGSRVEMGPGDPERDSPWSRKRQTDALSTKVSNLRSSPVRRQLSCRQRSCKRINSRSNGIQRAAFVAWQFPAA